MSCEIEKDIEGILPDGAEGYCVGLTGCFPPMIGQSMETGRGRIRFSDIRIKINPKAIPVEVLEQRLKEESDGVVPEIR